jgi:hypothetical protein
METKLRIWRDMISYVLGHLSTDGRRKMKDGRRKNKKYHFLVIFAVVFLQKKEIHHASHRIL